MNILKRDGDGCTTKCTLSFITMKSKVNLIQWWCAIYRLMLCCCGTNLMPTLLPQCPGPAVLAQCWHLSSQKMLPCKSDSLDRKNKITDHCESGNLHGNLNTALSEHFTQACTRDLFGQVTFSRSTVIALSNRKTGRKGWAIVLNLQASPERKTEHISLPGNYGSQI